MNSEIICVASDTLPEGQSSSVTDYISKKLFELGHRTTFESVASPKCDDIERLLRQAVSRSDIVILLCDVEPEINSLSKRALSSVTGLPLVANDQAIRSVKDYCTSIGVVPSPDQLSAGIVLDGAKVLKNELGLCPGLEIDYQSNKIFLLPSAEGELTHMFENCAFPLLSVRGTNSTHTVNVIGLSLEEIENKLSALQNRSEFALIPEKHGAQYDIQVSAIADTQDEAEKICMRAVASVKFALGKSAFSVDSKGIQFEVVSLLREKGLKISTAESCTGGKVSEMLTDVDGSSQVFEYGISAYSNRIKQEILKVPSETLEKYSAISSETAKFMAINVRAIGSSTIGVGITGNAGPTASEGKPIGLVYIAIADSSSYIVTELKLSEKLSRNEIREIASVEALNLVRRYVICHPEEMPGMLKYSNTKPIINETNINNIEAPVLYDDNDNDGFITETAVVTEKKKETVRSFDSSNAVRFDSIDDDDTISEEYRFANSSRLAETLSQVRSNLLDFCSAIFPSKGDSRKRIFVKIGFIASLLAFITSATVLLCQLTGDSSQRNILSSAQESWDFDNTKDANDNFSAFETLNEKNEDIKGWITIPGTKVNNPIYQTYDNEYYLSHNMHKEKSRYGALFFDYRCNLSGSQSQNLIIYGHEMKDGTMFGTLKQYKSLSFYKQNPTFTLTQLNNQSEYKIFSVMILNATPTDDNGYMYNYVKEKFSTQKLFLDWTAEAFERSIINTNVDVQADDQIVTLVTCSNDFDNARLVIMARKTRENEGSGVSTSSAVLNPNPRYPQAWYDKKGLNGYIKSINPETFLEENTSQTLSTDESLQTSSDISNDESSDLTSSDNDMSQDSNISSVSSQTGSDNKVISSSNSSTAE